MAKSLVIVESPAKARTINRYLGKEYLVKSSVGHIRDLPEAGADATDAKARAAKAAKTRQLDGAAKLAEQRRAARARLVARMGVDPDHDWAARYEILRDKKKVVDDLRKAADQAEVVYLATDLDREGEAIAWHLQEAIGGDPGRYRRVVFNEITRKAIQEAFANPAKVNIDRVNAQQARRFLDRVVGFEVSPLLWAKVARGLSAGRVQSVAVRLVVEREREIRAFIPEEYWEVFADLHRPDEPSAAAQFQLVKDGDENFRPTNQTSVDLALQRLQGAVFRVGGRDDRPTQTRPPSPLITSTLQQAASARLGFGVKKTMILAQRLYEGGYITYMRTDSTNLSSEAVEGVRAFIQKEFGDRYLPERPNLYAPKADSQEAHEAIRPTDVRTASSQLSGVDADAVRLYDLIWRQFVACQMTRAEYLSTTINVDANGFQFRARGRVLRFDGFTKVHSPAGRGDDDVVLPDLKVGEVLDCSQLLPSQHFTKPPARFGEASLVRELEKRGIGRPSTYASIISTIQDRGYVSLRDRRFYAEKIGELVTDRLLESFNNLMDFNFTAQMEAELDEVASGKLPWKRVLNEFYGDFSGKLKAAQGSKGMRSNLPTETNLKCPKCGRPMQVRTASKGVFLGCSGYALPVKERCTQTINLAPAEDFVDAQPSPPTVELDRIDEAGEEGTPIEQGDERESVRLRAKQRCPICGTAMDAFLVDEHRKLHVCGNNPDCAGFVVETGQYRLKGYEGPTIECDKCGSPMQLKSGRFGRYFGCSNSECRNTRKLLRSGQPAPPKSDPIPMPELRCERVDDFYVLRDGAAGLFLAASEFPKKRETRPPKVGELIPHQNELAPKYRHLCTAPVQDGDGNPAIVRFARKTAEHFVSSDNEGSGKGQWRAFYREGKWIEQVGSAEKAEKGTSGRRARRA